ncbi:MAG: DUF3500 domain-containing protein [Cytophagaceae bacterium]|nr:DUF3500 domain-containing protein [Cytophagaceae bacterium]
MKNFSCLLLNLLLLSTFALAQQPNAPAMRQAAQTFVKSLDEGQRQQATFAFDNAERFDWHYIPRERKGLPLKRMNDAQRQAALALLHTGLSDEGYAEAAAIFDLENVLRVVESRPPNDTRRDPENYSFTVFGDPASAKPWGWRVDGHHLSLHFSSIENKVISMTPTFMGSNPGTVLADVPQKGKQVLKGETELGFQLLNLLDETQLKKTVIAETSPNEIFTANSRKASLEKQEGLTVAEMTAPQKKAFMALLQEYLGKYPITLANQQMDRLKLNGLDNIRFAWAGNRQPEMGVGKGHYYRIHGPTILIEYDNTQNNANHVHTVVRDLTNDFGDDALADHYKREHK